MRYEPNDQERRREQDYERLGTREPKCTRCDERDPRALTGTHPDILCYEHAGETAGRDPIEGQHPAGRTNDRDLLVPARGNDHRVWDELKADWPERTRMNTHGSPLLKAAASVRTVLDWFREIVQRVLGWVPAFLEELDRRLEARLGRGWWNGLGFEGGPR